MRLSPGIGLRHQRRQVSFRSASSVVHEDMNALMLQGALRLEIPLPASFTLQLDGAGYIGEGRFRPAPLADISSDWQYAWVRLSDERTGQASGYEWNAAFHYALNEHVSLSLGYGVTQDYRHLWNDPFVSLYFSANNPPAVYLYDQYAFATGMLRERISSYSLGLHVRL
jgi:outer membrane protein (TIGR04327 family)